MENPKSILAGKTIVVTRPQNRGDKLTAMLNTRSARVIFFPTIDIVPPESWETCDRAIAEIGTFDVVVWTSANAVRMFCSRCVTIGANPRELDGLRMVAVGPVTREALREFGLSAEIFNDVRAAEDLNRHLTFNHRRVLFPRGDKAMGRLPEGLRQQQNEVTDVIVYRTQKAQPPDAVSLRRVSNADAVVFFSPSSFENFIECQPPSDQTVLAAIGPTTAQRIRNAGYRCAVVSEKADVESLVSALENYFEHAMVI